MKKDKPLDRKQLEALLIVGTANRSFGPVSLPCALFHYRGAAARLEGLVRRGLLRYSLGYVCTEAGREAAKAYTLDDHDALALVNIWRCRPTQYSLSDSTVAHLLELGFICHAGGLTGLSRPFALTERGILEVQKHTNGGQSE